MSYSMEAFKMAFGQGSPAQYAKELTASLRKQIQRIPDAARGNQDTVRELTAAVRPAAQAIKDGNLDTAFRQIVNLRLVLDLAEAAPTEDHESPPKPLPRTPAAAIPPAASVAASSASASQARSAAPAVAQVAATKAPVSSTPTAAYNSTSHINGQNLMFDLTAEKPSDNVKINTNFQVAAPGPVAPAAPAAPQSTPAARPVAPVAVAAAPAAAVVPQAVAAALPLWYGARKEALKSLGWLNEILSWALEREPYQSDLSKRGKLAKAFEVAAEPINAKIGVGNTPRLPDADRLKAYQGAAEAARAAVVRFKSVIITAQNTVATERKAAFDALANDEVRNTWIDQHFRSTHGKQIINDMIAHLGGRAKTDRDKKLVKLVVAAETACLQTLQKQRAEYDDGYCYEKIKSVPWMLLELQNFARRWKGAENVLFLEAVDDGVSPASLIDEYIAENSRRNINLSAAMRRNVIDAKNRLDRALGDGSSDARRSELKRELREYLDAAKHEIKNLVVNNYVSPLAAKKQAEFDAQIKELQVRLADHVGVLATVISPPTFGPST